MSAAVGKLSSYFTKRRGDKASDTKNTGEGNGRPISSVRARLEKKLHVQQKSGFAFNFAVESDAADLPEERSGGTGAAEKDYFRFGFTPTNTKEGNAGTPAESQGSGGGGGAAPRADQDFSIEIERRRAQPQGKGKPRRKRAGKKKKSGKGKGKAAEHIPRPELPPEPSEPAATAHPSTAGDGGGTKSNITSPPGTAAKCSSVNLGFDAVNPDVTKLEDFGARRERAPLRPPPGFTLESWKDPTLTGEERRRRRFGSGVRNMAAIQRRCDARRELAANDDLEVESSDLPGANREAPQEAASPEAEIPADVLPHRAGGDLRFSLSALISVFRSTAAPRLQSMCFGCAKGIPAGVGILDVVKVVLSKGFWSANKMCPAPSNGTGACIDADASVAFSGGRHKYSLCILFSVVL